MDGSALSALVAALMVAAELLSGFPTPADPPSLVAVERGELVARACRGPCGIRALFPPGRTIYVDAELVRELDADRIDTDGIRNVGAGRIGADVVFARSVVLHEIVHYLQQEGGAFTGLPACERWLARERQALFVQRRWLAEQKVSPRRVRSPLLGPRRIGCRDIERPPRR